MEFSDKKVVNDVMKASGHNDRNHIIPSQSRMLWFKANQKKKEKAGSSPLNIPLICASPVLTRLELNELFESAEDVSFLVKTLSRNEQVYGKTLFIV